jgi:hypothetical protein
MEGEPDKVIYLAMREKNSMPAVGAAATVLGIRTQVEEGEEEF